MKHRVFSFSAIDGFRKCPRQYHEERVLKLYPYVQSEEAKWGDYVHEKMEHAICCDEPLPHNVSQYQPLVDAVRVRRSTGWDVQCEATFEIHNDGTATLTDAEDVWWAPRNKMAGFIDLLMVSPDGREAVIVDWKTNKSAKYAKPEQVELYALAVMLALPTVETVSGCLLFVADNYRMVRQTYTRDDVQRLGHEWNLKVQQLQFAFINNNFPEAEYTPLCGWCQCQTCPNWERGQDFRAKRDRRKR